MPLQDVSDDQLMINWLRQSGHGHLIEDQRSGNNAASTNFASPLGAAPPTSQLSHSQSSPNYPPPNSNALSSPPLLDHITRSGSFRQTDQAHPINYVAAGSPPIHSNHPTTSGFEQRHSPLHFASPSPPFVSPSMNDQQLDHTIESMRRDPNTRIVQRPPAEDVVYKQRVFVRYLQPPTPPVGGTIIVREKQEPGPPPDPPIVLKRAPPPPPTPPPVIIREQPPPLPAAEGTTVIDKLVPPPPKAPPQVIIEQYPQLPPKPRDVIIERWLPQPPRQRRILYERLPPAQAPPNSRPIIVQYGPPHVRVQREVIATPGTQLPYPQHSLPSFASQHPFPSAQPGYNSLGQSPANIILMQNGQPAPLLGSSLNAPLTCVCSPNQSAGLGSLGGSTSALPLFGQTPGQPLVYNVPDNVPIDNVLRQLGVDPHTVQRSASYPSAGPHSAVSHVWNAASHANPYEHQAAVSHVWNAAAHATETPHIASPNATRVWDRIENYLHPNYDAARAVWNHIPHPNAPPQQPPPPGYPPPRQPPPPSYPPQQPPSSSYPPPSSSYPPASSSYPPPPPPTGGPAPSGSASGSALARLFGQG